MWGIGVDDRFVSGARGGNAFGSWHWDTLGNLTAEWVGGVGHHGTLLRDTGIHLTSVKTLKEKCQVIVIIFILHYVR